MDVLTLTVVLMILSGMLTIRFRHMMNRKDMNDIGEIPTKIKILGIVILLSYSFMTIGIYYSVIYIMFLR